MPYVHLPISYIHIYHIQIVLKPEHIQLATGSYAKSHLAPLGFLQKYTQTSANQGANADGNSDWNSLTLAPVVLPCINPSELLTALLEKEEQNKTGQTKRKGGHNSDPSKKGKSDNQQQESTATPALNDYVPLGPSGHNSEGEQEEEGDEGKDEVLLFRDAKVAKEKAGKPEKVIIMTDKKRKVNEISEKVIKVIKSKR